METARSKTMQKLNRIMRNYVSDNIICFKFKVTVHALGFKNYEIHLPEIKDINGMSRLQIT